MRKCKLLSAFLAVLLIVSTFLSLTACHGLVALPEFHVNEGFNPDEPIEITFWAKNENNRNQQKVYRDAVASFQRLYPNIKVNLKLYSDYNEIYKDVLKNIRTQTTPNVCITYPDHIATYNTGTNIIAPLDELMASENFGLGSEMLKFDAPTKEEIIPQFLNEGVINGTQYALPYMRSTEACYINADLVEKLGYEIPDVLTWDFVWEVSEAAMALGKRTETIINEKTGKETEVELYNLNDQQVLIPFIYKSTDNMMLQMLEQKGIEYSTEKGEIDIFNETTEEILYEIAEHTESGAFSTFKIKSYPGNFLNAGQCIFAVDSTAGATWMGSEAPQIDIPEEELIKFDIQVRGVPQYDTENQKMISQGPSICIFNKENPNEVMASWLFVQYLLTNEVQIAYSQTEGYLPVTSKAHNDPAYQEYLSKAGEPDDPETGLSYYKTKIDAAKLLLNNLDNTFITPVFNGSTNLRNAAGQLIEEVAKSVNRKQTVDDEYMDKLYDRMSTLYHLEEISASEEGPTKINFDGISKESVILIATIGGVWAILGGYYVFMLVKKNKKAK